MTWKLFFKKYKYLCTHDLHHYRNYKTDMGSQINKIGGG